MVFIRYAFTVTATGKHVAMNMHHYWKFRDGKVCYVRSPGHRAGRRGPDALTRVASARTHVSRHGGLDPLRGGEQQFLAAERADELQAGRDA